MTDGLFTRSHRIPPATTSIQCLETHDQFPWPVPRSCALRECVWCSGRKCVYWFCSCSERHLLYRPLLTADLSLRLRPTACRISTASSILLHPSLITVVSGGVNTVEPWERFSVDQSIKSGMNGSGTKHLVFNARHPSKCWPRSLALNQPTVPVLQVINHIYIPDCFATKSSCRF